MEAILDVLLRSDEPAVRYKALALTPASPDELAAARRQIPTSARVQALLASRQPDGTLPEHPYQKWQGAHWVLAQLADLDYPPGDESLLPLRDQVFDWLFSAKHEKHIRLIDGRVRRCASQESNALYSTLRLGLADERADELATRLMRWQWPDGGWNCDRRPAASHSSFHESLLPLRALNLYARLRNNPQARQATLRAAGHFLERRLYLRLSSGDVIDPDFIRLHYPAYWHYDYLGALRFLHEAGLLADPRCRPALQLLLSRRLPDGGFPAEGRYYTVTTRPVSGRSPCDWGPVSTKQHNPFVTVEALRVLSAAGMLQLTPP